MCYNVIIVIYNVIMFIYTYMLHHLYTCVIIYYCVNEVTFVNTKRILIRNLTLYWHRRCSFWTTSPVIIMIVYIYIYISVHSMSRETTQTNNYRH